MTHVYASHPLIARLQHKVLRHLYPVVVLCVVLLTTLPAAAQNSQKIRRMKAERTEMKKQIGEMESMLSKSKKDVASQMRALSILDAQIAEREDYIAQIQAENDSLARRIKSLQRQLTVLERELNACKNNYRSAMTHVARSRNTQSRWMFVLMAEDFRQLYRRMRYTSQYARYQRAQGEVIKQKEARVEQQRKALVNTKNEKARLLTEGKKERAALEEKKQQRQTMVGELNKKQKQIQKQLRSERKKYQQLNASIDKLIQEEIAAAERRRKEEERRRKEEERRQREAAKSKKGKATKGKSQAASKSTATPNFNAPDDAERRLSSDFATNKGNLPVPITGSYAITGRFGKYNVEGLKGVTLDNKGVNYTGRRGATARCIFDGEVCSVVNIGGTYVVIVRHGVYFSVYSNLSKVSVRRGQRVATKQNLGTVATDKNGNCTLHFQLRKNTQKLNPAHWIGR